VGVAAARTDEPAHLRAERPVPSIAFVHVTAARRNQRGACMNPEKKNHDRGGLMIALVMLALLGLILALNH